MQRKVSELWFCCRRSELIFYLMLKTLQLNSGAKSQLIEVRISRTLYCNGFDQRVARQQTYKHGPTRNNTGSYVFSRSDRRTNRLAG
jgi:hypothetical protein